MKKISAIYLKIFSAAAFITFTWIFLLAGYRTAQKSIAGLVLFFVIQFLTLKCVGASSILMHLGM